MRWERFRPAFEEYLTREQPLLLYVMSQETRAARGIRKALKDSC